MIILIPEYMRYGSVLHDKKSEVRVSSKNLNPNDTDLTHRTYVTCGGGRAAREWVWYFDV